MEADLNQHADDVPSSSSSGFKWRIENVSKLTEENHFSPIFIVGRHKWQLLAFRRGCNMNGYLSVYVVAFECKHWRFAKFSLAVVDQTNNKNTLKKGTEDMYRFTEDDNHWGFDDFIQLKELRDPSNGYIVNDACTVEVEFCLESIQDFKQELVPMELMESAEEVQERSFGVETTTSTVNILASTSVCLDNNSSFTCAFCQTSTETKGCGSMFHIASGEEVIGDEVSEPIVVHVHRNCVEWAPRVYYVGKTVMNLELEVARGSNLKCCCCGLKGAALGCFIRSCRNTYHVPCAFDTSGCRWDCEGYLMLCPSHSGTKFSHEKTKNGIAKDNSSAVSKVKKIMSGREDNPRRPTPERGGQPRGKGSRYIAAPRNTSHSNTPRSFVPRSSQPEPSGAGKRPAVEKDHVVLKPPPKSYMKPCDSWRNVKLEDLKLKHGLQDFDVRFFGDGDDLTYDMIKGYEYDSTHLLTTVGQLEAGLRLPLYKSDDTFCYDVLASRDKVHGSTRRSVVQYSGNGHRLLDECRLRGKGQSRLSCYTPDPNQREWYTPANFNVTYKDYVSSTNRKKWSVGLARRKLTLDQYEAGMCLLLEEVDNIKIKCVPGTENYEKTTPFPKGQKLRDDHDFRWHRTPIEIIGPWAWGWSLNTPGKYRRLGPERYGDYCPWLLNFKFFSFDYAKEDQYDFSEKARISKKRKTSRRPANIELVDEDIPEASSTRGPDEDNEDEEYEYDGGHPSGMIETVCDNIIPDGKSLGSSTAFVEGIVEDYSDRTPSPNPSVIKEGQILLGGEVGGSFVLEPVEEPESYPSDRVTTKTGPSTVTIPNAMSPWFEDVELVEVESTTEKGPEVVGDVNPTVVDGTGQTVAGGTGPVNVGDTDPSLLLPLNNASSSVKGTDVVAGLVDVDMSNDEAIYQWASKRGLLTVHASSSVVEEASINALVRGKMRVAPYDYDRDAFLHADRIHGSLRVTHAPATSVAEMRSLVDGQAYFLPQFALATLSQSRQYCYELYQLEKLKASKFESLYRDVDAELVAKRETLCNFQLQLIEERKLNERAQSLEQEAVNLKKDLAQVKADLEESVRSANKAIEKSKATVIELEVAKDEIVSLHDKLNFSEGLVSSTKQRAITVENDVTKLRAQVASAGMVHAMEIARVKNEARDRLTAKMGAFLAKVNKDTGKNYQLKF